MTYLIRFPVGDWSDDGHGKCDYFEVRSSHPVQHLREVHFKAPDVVGFEIGDICSDYEDNQLSAEVVEKLKAIGLNPSNYVEDDGDVDEYYIYSDNIIKLWLDVLCHIDPDVKLEIVEPNAENINFYGFDSKKRHLSTPGYGTFQ